MKNKIFWLIVLVVCIGVALSLFLVKNLEKSKQKSKILVSKTEIIKTEEGKTIVKMPMAQLPEPEKEGKAFDALEGKVVLVANNPESGDSSMRVSVLSGTEIVVVANGLYVNTLRKLYLGKDVRLSGKWIKDAVIYGKRYRTFWIEELKETAQK